MTQSIDRISLARLLAIALGILIATVPAIAQSDTITQNPNAKPLRRIWSIAGNPAGGDRVGEAISGLPDINGDGINEFGVYYGTAAQWRIFYGVADGNISHTPSLIIRSIGLVYGRPLAWGNFWGDGNKTVVFPRGAGSEYLLMRIDTTKKELDSTPVAVLDTRTMTPIVYLSSIVDVVAADLDGDGADELIIAPGGVVRGGVIQQLAEIWIYRGGPNFQVDTPTVILRNNDSTAGIGALYIGQWDGDHKLDIAARIGYRGDSEKIKFWFSTEGSPWNWTKPDRSFIPTTSVGGTAVLDCDGDSILDIAMANGIERVNLFRSGSGKDAHTRSFAPDDADIIFRRHQFAVPERLGYMGDSAQRYEMLGIAGADDGGPTTLFGFNGGPNGPDHAFDVYDFGGVYNVEMPIADVTGDGWSDYIHSYAAANFNAGIAVLYAGGPYIPRDSAADVEYATAVTGVRPDAVSVWPVPARDELHIAWRGDLHRMPERFAVHDALGRLVARGEVESWHGEALWRCESVPAGAYFLTVYDAGGAIIATARLLKE